MTVPHYQLAIHGAEPMVPEGPPDWPIENPAVWEALHKAYSTGMWGRYHGEAYEALVRAIQVRTQSDYAWLCASGTIAVEIALRAMKIGAGDEVLISAYDFPGNFRAIESVGALPVLVDLEPRSWRMDLESLDAIRRPATKAMIASHLHGELLPMRQLTEWAVSHGIATIEDACQCPGAQVDGQPAGSWGDIGVFSFGGSKLLTAGRGGALVTQRAELFQRIKVTAERGNDAYPLSELQASVLLPQLQDLDQLNTRRHVAAARIQQRLAQFHHFIVGPRTAIPTAPAHPVADDPMPNAGARTTGVPKAGTSDTGTLDTGTLDTGTKDAGTKDAGTKDAGTKDAGSPIGDAPAFYKFPFRLPDTASANARTWLITAARAEGIALDIGFRGFVRRSANRCRRPDSLAEAKRAAAGTLLLHHPILLADDERLDRTIEGLRRVIQWWVQYESTDECRDLSME